MTNSKLKIASAAQTQALLENRAIAACGMIESQLKMIKECGYVEPKLLDWMRACKDEMCKEIKDRQKVRMIAAGTYVSFRERLRQLEVKSEKKRK